MKGEAVVPIQCQISADNSPALHSANPLDPHQHCGSVYGHDWQHGIGSDYWDRFTPNRMKAATESLDCVMSAYSPSGVTIPMSFVGSPVTMEKTPCTG